MKNTLKTAADILKAFFLYMPLSQILNELFICEPDNEDTFFRRKNANGFTLTASRFIPYMQQLELEYSIEELRCRTDKMISVVNGAPDQIPMRNVLDFYAEHMINRFHERYRFAYKYCDIWRKTALEIDEDIFVISKIIQENRRRNISTQTDFSWPFCIEHDNITISKILCSGEGVSDNHFHLRGSSPYYQFSWVYMMANPARPELSDKIRNIEKDKLFNGIKLELTDENDSLAVLWIKAAAIRLYLTQQLLIETGQTAGLDMQNLFSQHKLKEILQAKCIVPEILYRMQNDIEKLRFFEHGEKQTDYIRTKNDGGMFFNLYGERYLLTELLSHHSDRWTECLIFLYLAVKNRFRSEVVQCNQLIGFDNFSKYQDRKDWFLEDDNEVEKQLVSATIASVIDGPKLHSLEMRISPSIRKPGRPNAAQYNIDYIRMSDSAIRNAIAYAELDYQTDQFYYTMHFPKRAEPKYKKGDELFCRHFKLREAINERAEGMLAMQKMAPDAAARVRGIDACSAEIQCRPEVFGPAFRRLVFSHSDPAIPQYQVTYHVAEHNYDIVDALRAIHEAILFLELRSGSRLGHATFLGISAEQFYADKGMSISMPLQNYIDNLVWMYFFMLNNLNEFPRAQMVLDFIRSKYYEHIHTLYGGETDRNLIPTIEEYNMAWLLRGDEPELYRKYQDDYFRLPLSFDSYMLCHSDPQMDLVRKRERIRKIYHQYHFDRHIRQNSQLPVCETITNEIVQIIDNLQTAMKKLLNKREICIECNPSSNKLISPIHSYAQHPITILFDKNLTEQSVRKTQMNVSVNTDDQSVFATSISNEYAYLAFSLEQLMNSEHEHLFLSSDIYDWIELLRRNGNAQSFINLGYSPGKLMRQFVQSDHMLKE